MNAKQIKITESNTTPRGASHNDRVWVTEASQLGLRPGQWPTQVETNLGNGRPFCYISRLEDGGCRYIQSCGILILDILND